MANVVARKHFLKGLSIGHANWECHGVAASMLVQWYLRTIESVRSFRSVQNDRPVPASRLSQSVRLRICVSTATGISRNELV